VNRIVAFLACSTLVALATQAQAIDLGLGLFKRKPKTQEPSKPEPTVKLRQLLSTMQADPDVGHRRTAAQDLREYDPRSTPEALAQLIVSLQKDPAPSVRAMAAESIGAIKQIYLNAGSALEAAEKNDSNADVRAAAKAALWQYQLNGYRASNATPTNTSVQTPEPPLTRPTPLTSTTPTLQAVQPDVTFRPITQGIGKGLYYQPTSEPPLAKTQPASRPITPSAPVTPETPSKPAPVEPLGPTIPAPVVPLDGPTIPAPVQPIDPKSTVPATLPNIPGLPSTLRPTEPAPLVPTIPTLPGPIAPSTTPTIPSLPTIPGTIPTIPVPGKS
jgi:hypothetical protein